MEKIESIAKDSPIYNLSGPRKPQTRLLFSQGRPPWYDHQGDQKDAFVIGICGGSGSGKTTVAKRIIETLKLPWVVVIGLDSFYKSLGEEAQALASKNEYDFDNPNALDLEKAATLIKRLKNGKKVEVPIYNFVTHTTENRTITVYGASVIIVEGIMTFFPKSLRDMIDLKIFIDADGDVRLTRRLRRDVVERGRNVEGILVQYLRFVKPNYDKYVARLQEYADMVVPWNYTNNVAIDIIVNHVARELGCRGCAPRKQLLGLANKRPIDSQELTNVHLLEQTTNVCSLHTILMDKTTSMDDFVFHTTRLCRILINHALKIAPYSSCSFVDDNGSEFEGTIPLFSNVYGVSILRAGEVLEKALTHICKDICMGKILIQTNETTMEPELHYLKLPTQISDGIVLLVDVSAFTGSALLMAIKILLDHDVKQENIYVTCLYVTSRAVHNINSVFPEVKIVCASIEEYDISEEASSGSYISNATEFSNRYFGIDTAGSSD